MATYSVTDLLQAGHFGYDICKEFLPLWWILAWHSSIHLGKCY